MLVTSQPSLLLKQITVMLCLPEPKTSKKMIRVFLFNSLVKKEMKYACEFYKGLHWQKLQ